MVHFWLPAICKPHTTGAKRKASTAFRQGIEDDDRVPDCTSSGASSGRVDGRIQGTSLKFDGKDTKDHPGDDGGDEDGI